MELQNIHLSIDEKNVLCDISMQWEKGESIAIMGANGAGKSSLLKVICSLANPNKGKINYPAGMSLKQWKASLGIVFPDTFLYDSLTGYENLQFYQKLYGKVDKNSINRLFEQVELAHVKHSFVRSYSKGMKQRLSIARAIVHHPSNLLLDEPFDGLDVTSKQVIEDLLSQLQKQGTGYILVSHDSKHAWSLCDRALLMHEGRIVHQELCANEGYLRFIEMYQSFVKENHHDVF